MTISFVIERIAEMATDGLKDNIRTAYPKIERAIPDASLPALASFPLDAQYLYQDGVEGETMVKVARVYELNYLYAKAGTGTVGQNQEAIEEAIDVIAAFYIARPGLWLDNATDPQEVTFNSKMLSDTGYIQIEYTRGNIYEGCKFRLLVEELVDIQYTD